MKQPDDRKASEPKLLEQKRGRGRPAKADALTPAERAKRYRDSKRVTEEISTLNRDDKTVTENRDSLVAPHKVTAGRQQDVQITKLKNKLALAEAERNAAIKECERFKANAYALQWKLDAEHLALVEAQNELVTLKNNMTKPPKVNPLAAEVRKLKKHIATQDAAHRAIVEAMRKEFASAITRANKAH